MKRAFLSVARILSAVAVLLLSGCESSVNKAADRVDQAVAALSQNSKDWQAVMQSLVSDLSKIEQNAAIDAQAIIARATAATQVEFFCGVDFLGSRVKEDLQRLSAKLRGKSPPPLEPIVCQLDFSPPQPDRAHINMARIPDEVLFYGYNFDISSPDAPELVLKYGGGEIPLKQWTTQPTHYLMTLKTAPSDGVQMCNLKDRTIVMRWGGKELYSLGVIANICTVPLAPTPLPERDLLPTPTTDTTYGAYAGGTGLNKVYGGNCSNGYVRSAFQVIVTNSQGKGSATFDGVWLDGTKLGWVDENDDKSCKIRVHYSISASFPNPSPNFVEVRVVIKEKGEQLPAPEAPPCTCK